MANSPHRDQLLQQLADAIDQVFWFTAVDPERVLYVSPAFEALWGIRAAELYEHPRLWVETIHPDDRARVGREFEDWLTGKIPNYRVSYRILRRDGVIRWILDHGAQLRDEDGRLQYASGVATDVTQERLAKAKLELALEDITRLKERLQVENVYLREELAHSGLDEIVGESESMRGALWKVKQVAATATSVLVLGETGTGKELFARAIHRGSRRKDRPLVKVNCAALASNLVESELFGHVKGAYTGAVTGRPGRFEIADKGTIFLDEIGDLDPGLQAKLLRVLQEGEFERVGSSKTTKVDVRVIAASHRDLRRAVREGSFRADLYHRLAVFPIGVPPLRERRGDVPLLVWHFLAQKSAKLGRAIDQVSPAAMQRLVEYDWPGNVRELENVIERAIILSSTNSLALSEALGVAAPIGLAQNSSPTLEELDREHITAVLGQCNWTIKGAGQAAERLGLPASTLRYRMKKLGITRPGHKSAP